MNSWKTPTQAQVDKAVVAIAHPARRRYFFDRLANPLWLGPLRDRGVFGEPPAPVIDDDQVPVQFPLWPESRYLARMAKHDAPTVSAVIAKIPDNGNVAIYQDFVDAALQMPSEHVEWAVERADAWLGVSYAYQLASKLGALMGKLANDGKTDLAMRLATTLLEVLPPDDPRTKPGSKSRREDERLRIDDGEYAEIVSKYLPPLRDRIPEDVLRFCCEQLSRAIALERKHDYRDDEEDGSYVWCPDVEHYSIDSRDKVESTLTAATRDAAHRLAETNPARISEIVALFESQGWRVFDRLSYHLLRCFADDALDIVSRYLTDARRFDVYSTRYEYDLLSESCFGRLDAAAREKILGWIEEGPDLEAFADREEKWFGERPDEDRLTMVTETWSRDRLAPIVRYLSQEWKDRHDRLVATHGEANRLPYYIDTGTFSHSRSPMAHDKLAKKSNIDLIAFLNNFRPSDDFAGSSVHGLADEFKIVVTTDPARIVNNWSDFTVLDPPYSTSVLVGLGEAANKNWKVEWWDGALRLCESASAAPAPPSSATEPASPYEDPLLDWAARGILNIVTAAFSNREAPLPLILKERVWALLEPLTSHPDPSPESESKKSEDSELDFATCSINCVRGQALHATIEYALWVLRAQDASTENEETEQQGFDRMPEVRNVLDAHLDTARDSSLAIRAVYGQWFPWLIFLDQKWATASVRAIFPHDVELNRYWLSAWSSYITYCPAYNDILRLLRPDYVHAIEQLPASEHKKRFAHDSKERLADHLMLLIGRGIIDIDDAMIVKFFESAEPSLRGHAIEFVGSSLSREKEAVPPITIDRFRRLWEARVDTILQSENDLTRDPELVAFGYWYASQKFDPSWAIQQLHKILPISKWAEPRRSIVRALQENMAQSPLEVLECAQHLMDGDREGWAISYWKEDLRKILGDAKSLAEPRIGVLADTIINRLGERGFFDFRDLLRR